MKYTDDKIQQQIEAYLNQDMTDFERSKFEKLIHDDDELHDEVEMQEATIEAIRNERMLGLKAGLSQVPISLWSVTLIETAKIAAVAVSLGIASVGGYYMYSNSQTQKNDVSSIEKTIVADSPSENEITENPAQPDNSAAEISSTKGFESNPDHARVPVNSGSTENAKSIGLGRVRTKSNSNTTTFGKSSVVNDTEMVEPNVKTTMPTNAKDIALPQDGISNKSVLETVNPEVVIKKDNKDKFHYQFSDSKLILYADFSNKIYEILELNQANQKSMFLSFQNKFYALEASKMEISPLKEVTDAQLIQVLYTYQKRKN